MTKALLMSELQSKAVEDIVAGRVRETPKHAKEKVAELLKGVQQKYKQVLNMNQKERDVLVAEVFIETLKSNDLFKEVRRDCLEVLMSYKGRRNKDYNRNIINGIHSVLKNYELDMANKVVPYDYYGQMMIAFNSTTIKIEKEFQKLDTVEELDTNDKYMAMTLTSTVKALMSDNLNVCELNGKEPYFKKNTHAFRSAIPAIESALDERFKYILDYFNK